MLLLTHHNGTNTEEMPPSTAKKFYIFHSPAVTKKMLRSFTSFSN